MWRIVKDMRKFFRMWFEENKGYVKFYFINLLNFVGYLLCVRCSFGVRDAFGNKIDKKKFLLL